MKRVHVISVHGTFAPAAKWAQGESTFIKNIRQCLPDHEFYFSQFVWSGKNSHSTREKYGHKLGQFIRGLADRSPNTTFVLLAHSHGGNIALVAQTIDPAIQRNILATVCLATPFINPTLESPPDRTKDPVLEFGYLLAITAFLIYATYELVAGVIPEWTRPLLVIDALAVLLGSMGLATHVGATSNAMNAQIAYAYDWSKIKPPICVVRTIFDEALTGLSAIAYVAAWIPVTGVFWYLHSIRPGEDNSLLFELVIYAIALLPIVGFWGYAARILRSTVRRLPFGERLDHTFSANFDISSIPAGISYYEILLGADIRGAYGRGKLMHSHIYDHPDAGVSIGSFLRKKLQSTHDA